MCKYIADVEFTLMPYATPGLFDLDEQERAHYSKKHCGKLLAFSSESLSRETEHLQIVPVGIILDEEGILQTIPVNRIKILTSTKE